MGQSASGQPPLVPPEGHRSASDGEIDEAHRSLVLHVCHDAARRTSDSRSLALDMDLEHVCTRVEADNVDGGKPDQDLAHPHGIALERCLQPCLVRHRFRLSGLCAHIVDAIPPSNPKHRFTSAILPTGIVEASAAGSDGGEVPPAQLGSAFTAGSGVDIATGTSLRSHLARRASSHVSQAAMERHLR